MHVRPACVYRFTDEVGRLWVSLADFFIRRTMFESARDVFEEGMASAMTVHDFSLIYDAYTQVGEGMPRALRWRAYGGRACGKPCRCA